MILKQYDKYKIPFNHFSQEGTKKNVPTQERGNEKYEDLIIYYHKSRYVMLSGL
jgi:hypothetical protein